MSGSGEDVKVQAVKGRGFIPSLLFLRESLIPIFLLIGLLYFMSVELWGQVVFVGDMTQERRVNPGETYHIVFTLLNPHESPVEVDLELRDFLVTDEKLLEFKPGLLERSNAGWIEIKNPRLLLGAKKQATLRIPVNVPKSLELKGSYFTSLIVKTLPGQIIKKGKVIKVALEYAVNVISTLPGGERRVDFEEVQVTGEQKDKLQVSVVNPGEEFLRLTLKSELEGVSSQSFRIYPGCKRRFQLNLQQLDDRDYSTRLFLDDGELLLIPIKINFRKGEEQEPLPLIPIGEDLERRRSRRNYIRLWLVFSAGSFRKGLSLTGSTSISGFRLGSGFRRFWMLDDRIYESYFTSLGLRIWKLSFNNHVLRFENQTLYNGGVSLELKKTYFNIGFISNKSHRVLNFHFTHTFKWGHRLQGFSYLQRERKGFSISYSIPITAYF